MWLHLALAGPLFHAVDWMPTLTCLAERFIHHPLGDPPCQHTPGVDGRDIYSALRGWDREREAQAKQRQQMNATQGVAIGAEGTEGQGRTLLLNLDPYYEVMVVMMMTVVVVWVIIMVEAVLSPERMCTCRE